MSKEDCNSSGGAQGGILEELTHRIRSALRLSRQERCNALHHDLHAGDALIEAQKLVSSSWKQWLRENCSLSVRTAMLYMQLARHRQEIEAEIDRVGELSLRGAARLISAPSKKSSKPKQLDLIRALAQATDAELTEALASLGLGRFLRVMPPDWRAEIQARVGHQVLSSVKERYPHKRLKHLKLVH